MKLCIFGDSLVYGTGVLPGESWPSLLRAHLEPLYQWPKVYALGIGGQRTDQLLKRFQVEAEAREPSHILFAMGVNDSKFQDKVPPLAFKENLEKLITLAKKLTPKIAFIGLTRIDEASVQKWPGELFHTNENIAAYDKILENFCNENKIPYRSVAEILKPGDYLDGLHPNATGHKKLFEKILPFVESWLK